MFGILNKNVIKLKVQSFITVCGFENRYSESIHCLLGVYSSFTLFRLDPKNNWQTNPS